MATETIDIVVRSDTRRVVRDLNSIGDAADRANRQIQALQAGLNRVSTANFTRQVNAAQSAVTGLGAGHQLTQLQQAIQQTVTQLQALNQQLGNTAQASQRMSNTFGGSVRALMGPLQAVIGYLSVKQVLEWADAWIAAAGKIKVFTSSQAEANAVLSEVFKIAQTTRQPLDEVAQLYNLLTIQAKELGKSQADMLRFTELVGKVLAIQGTSAQQARGALLQLAQALGTGTVRAQEFNSLMQNAPFLLKVAADNMKGVNGSVATLRAMMKDGKLKSQEFFDAIMKGAGEIDTAFAKTNATFAQSFTVITNAITKYIGQLNEATGASNKFFELANYIAANMDGIAKAILVIGAAAAVAFAPALLVAFGGALGVVAAGLGTITAVLLANPFVLLAAGAAYAALFGDKVLIGADNMTTLADVINVVKPKAEALWTTSVAKVQEFGSELLKIDDKLGGVGSTIDDELSKWQKKFAGFTDGLQFNFVGVVTGLARVFDTIGGVIRGVAFAIANGLGSLPTVVDQVGVDMRNALRDRMEELVNAVVSGINKLRALIGKDPLGFVQLAREQGNANAYKDYGAQVASAFEEGFKSQGKALEGVVNGIIADAQKSAQERIFRQMRADEKTVPNLNLHGAPTPGIVDPKAAKKAAAEALKIARQQVEDAKSQIQELLDKYRQGFAEQTELERHKQVMLKAQYDQGLLNYRDYNQQLEEMQSNEFTRLQSALLGAQTDITTKLAELKVKLKRAGASDQEVANVTQDLTTKLAQLNAQLEKVQNARSEKLAAGLTEALKPAVELVRNEEKTLAILDNNYDQRVRQMQAQANINQLSEREQFILTNTNQLLNSYEDKLKQVEAVRDRMLEQGVFDDLTNPATLNAFVQLNKLIDELRQRIEQIKGEAPNLLGQVFDAKKTQELANELEKSLREGILNAGKDGSKGLRGFIEAELIKKPFRIAVEAALKPVTQSLANGMASALQPVIGGLTGIMQNILQGSGSPAQGAGGNFGSRPAGGGLIGNALNIAGVAGSMFGAGGLTGALTAGAGWMTGATTFGGAMTAAGSLIGTGTAAGAMSGIAMGLGAVAPWLLAAYAIYSIFAKDGGGPKQDGVFGMIGSGIGQGQRTLDPQMQSAVSGLQRSFNQIASSLGGSGVGIRFGMGVSSDPKGDSPTFLNTSVSRNGVIINDQLDKNVGRSQEALQAAIAEQTTNAIVAALKESGIKQEYLDYFESIRSTIDSESQIAELENLAKLENLTRSMKDMGAAFVNFTQATVAARDRIAQLSGGIDQLAQNTATYIQNFFSESEQRAQQIQQITRVLQQSGLGVTAEMIGSMSRENFRQIVEGLDLTTEAGQNVYAAMLGVSGAFAQLTDNSKAVQDAAEKQAQREQDIANAKAKVQDAYDREKTALENTKEKLQSTISSLQDFQRSLGTSSLSPLTPGQQYANSKSQLLDAIANNGGKIPDGFQDLAKTFLDASHQMFASGDQYASDFKMIQDLTAQGIREAQDQLSAAQQQIQRLDLMVAGILSTQQATLTVAEAINQLNQLTAQGTAAVVSAINSGSNFNPTVNANKFGTHPELATYNGIPASSTDNFNVNIPPQLYAQFGGNSNPLAAVQAVAYMLQHPNEFPAHAGGISNIPYNGYLMTAHRGEAVLNATDAAIWRSGQAGGGIDMSGLIDCINRLEDEVAELRKQQADATRVQIAAQQQALQHNAQAVVEGLGGTISKDNWRQDQRAKTTLE
jgi:tape measure domain-containing protein